ncbi:MAG: GNAT family N-acetyltransferase [Draconibacterium sp.]|nr:GNAT family N-acetyltransferase [Draconibacterium sp.]
MIRPAKISEHSRLTEISFLSKGTWNYPKEFFEIWAKELTISPEYIQNDTVFVYEKDKQIAGFITLIENKEDKMIDKIYVEKGYWMDHLFIHPQFQNQGIGSELVKYLLKFCMNKQIKKILVFVDPNATGFYKILGATFIRYENSSIPGRKLPIYCFENLFQTTLR